MSCTNTHVVLFAPQSPLAVITEEMPLSKLIEISTAALKDWSGKKKRERKGTARQLQRSD